jgi:two-component system, NarL family, response regulator YdfI
LIRVLAHAKSAITRAGLETVVRADPRFEIVGAGYRDGDVLHAMREYSPDVVLIDSTSATLPHGLEAVLHSPGTPAMVLLVANPVRAELRRTLQAGVRSVLLRDSPPGEILSALDSAAAGLIVVSPEVLDALLPWPSELPTPDRLPVGEPLTARESEILALLADGAGNKEIGSRLHISEHTVKFHVSSILGKLGVATRTEAVSRGFKEGLIVI